MNSMNVIAKAKQSPKTNKLIIMLIIVGILLNAQIVFIYAESAVEVAINGEGSDVVRIIVIMTMLAIAPFILLMMTCFTRIVIVFSLLRHAMGLQQTPPNQVLIGLALFITFFIMNPVLTEINDTALKPYNDGIIEAQEFLDKAEVPLKEFMLSQTTPESVELFKGLSKDDKIRKTEGMNLPMHIVVPSFITSELKRAFLAGFLIFIPFLVIDMVVASTLMSMGMIMLPPVMISMPFKIMLFVVVDGWSLLIKTLVMTYN